MKIALIPCACTEWRTEGRLLGRTELSAAPAAEERCTAWVETLRLLMLARILHSPDELAKRTARLIGRALHVPARSVEDLSEVDFALWAGLTDEELRMRFASAYRQLEESPLAVTPPGGENLGVAAARLEACLRRRLRGGEAAVGLVLRPVALALARYVLGEHEESRIWRDAHSDELVVVTVDGGPAPFHPR
jgi:broad specificity phosphatase PhoE